MKKLILYVSVICLGMVSCTQEFAVPEGELPEWLGASLYEELKNPKSLEGTFNTYVRLVDDLGYAEVLGKTGSKTIFPANDEAFEAFFKDGNNRFGKDSYDKLTMNEKAQLLYSSMLDNAILVGNLTTETYGGGNSSQGKLVKHPTNMTLLQSVEPLYSQNMPSNNKYFAPWKDQGKSMNALFDNTVAPMVHFSGEYFLNNGMTVVGTDNDFFVITGNDYKDGDAYIFNRKIVKGDVTCQNGYIHQLDGVLTNPGNIAQMLRGDANTSHIARMLDYFAVPVDMGSTFYLQYQDYAKEFGTQDSIYAIRYLSKNSQTKYGAKENTKFNQPAKGVVETNLLEFDPGWNYFTPSGSVKLDAEIAAFFAPTNEVVEDYFSTEAAYIVKNLGVPGLPYGPGEIKNTINDHLDAIYNNDPNVIVDILKNIMKAQLSKAVPSKFYTVQNDAFELLGVTPADIKRKADGKYDVAIANNGVIYYMNKFFGPELYKSVLGPSSIYQDMSMMGAMLKDKSEAPGKGAILGADMYYYLLSMKSRYAVFVPTDNDDFFFIDPASVNDKDGLKALRFMKDPKNSSLGIVVQRYFYDPVSNTYSEDPSVGPVAIEKGYFNSQIGDMLNYHTVVLDGTTGLNGNHYYLTKHGGAIYVPDGVGNLGSSIKGGAQMETTGPDASKVTEYFGPNSKEAKITNGSVYRLDRPIMPTINNVYKTIKNMGCSDFLQFCDNFDDEDLLTFAGYVTGGTEEQKETQKKKIVVFGTNDVLNMLGSYNYTMFVPQDMEEAYDNGLPRWEDVKAIYKQWADVSEESEEKEAAREQVRAMLDKMHDFVLYHIQNNSVFDDIKIDDAPHQTFCVDKLGIALKVALQKNGSNVAVVDEAANTRTNLPVITISNKLARDVVTEEAEGYDVNNKSFTYNKIKASSFVVVHAIDKPLCYNKDYKY